MKAEMIAIEAPVFPCWMWNDRDQQWYYFPVKSDLIRWWNYTYWTTTEPHCITDKP